MGTLYLVATPIGNLEDISARALRILSEACLVAAEDTRQTKKLLTHYNIHTRLLSYHAHSRPADQAKILEKLEGGDVALVSDAGTPGLNDPGYELVQAALQAGHKVSPIPGACAPVAALVASGLPTDAFLYLGYLPRKKGDRKRSLAEVADLPYTLVFLETPQRLLSALADLVTVLGDRQVAVARELTKVFEEIFRGSLAEALAYFREHAPRGEFSLVIAGKPTSPVSWSSEQLKAAIQNHLAKGESPTQIASQLATQSKWKRRAIYQLVINSRSPKTKTGPDNNI